MHGDNTSEALSEMDEIKVRIIKEEEGYDKTFHNAQQDFAEKNKMKLSENELQNKIDKMK
jgi:hypothetical protein